MTWIAAILIAGVAFAVAVFAFKLSKTVWTSLLAALTLGLAGYALQASPDIPAAPKAGQTNADEQMFDIVETRRALMADSEKSSADFVLVADAMARQGKYEEASQMLAGVTASNPRDFDAWLAQGNALVEHADGTLTAPALYAYRRAIALKPDHLAPQYFLGASLIRQGRMMEARQVWADSLANAAADATGREIVAGQLGRLEEMLGAIATQAQQSDAQPASQSASQ